MERAVRFNSDGVQIAGVLFDPEAAADSSCPGVVLCQGMIGVKEYFWFPTIARRLAELGYVALIWDYRGVGESGGWRQLYFRKGGSVGLGGIPDVTPAVFPFSGFPVVDRSPLPPRNRSTSNSRRPCPCRATWC